jgi:hypothetical protein
MILATDKLLTALKGLCIKRSSLNEVKGLFQDAIVALSRSKYTFFEVLANERMASLFLSEEMKKVKGAVIYGKQFICIGVGGHWRKPIGSKSDSAGIRGNERAYRSRAYP